MADVFMHNVYGMESNISLAGLALSLTLSFILGAALANIYYHIDPDVSKGFTTTLALFPPCICVIMLLLSKSAGSGIAAIGAFALLRYKSAPGTARELLALLISIGTGIASSTGFLLATMIFTIPVYLLFYLFSRSTLWTSRKPSTLRRRISLEPSQRLETREMLEELLRSYADSVTLVETKCDYNKVTEKKTVRYTYDVTLSSEETEGIFIDSLVERKTHISASFLRKGRFFTFLFGLPDGNRQSDLLPIDTVGKRVYTLCALNAKEFFPNEHLRRPRRDHRDERRSHRGHDPMYAGGIRQSFQPLQNRPAGKGGSGTGPGRRRFRNKR